MDYRRHRERALRALSDGLKRLPAGFTEVDNLIDSAVREAWKMEPRKKLYGFLTKEKPEVEQKEIRLTVPFWKQTDNYRDANRTCFSSSMAMVVEYLSPDKLTGDNDYVKTVFSIGDTTSPTVQVKALDRYGIAGQFRKNLDFADLDSELAQGFPVGIGILHRGTPDKPTGGHWIVVIGKTADGLAYYCHDPYGSIADGYQGDVNQGNGIQYSINMLRKRWTVEGKNSGWGMICRKKSSAPATSIPTLVTPFQLEKIFGRMPTLDQIAKINRCLIRFQIDTPLRMRHFLSQCAHESGGLQYMEEIASGKDYEGREDLGNTQPGDGPRFKGVDPLQMTGRFNYQAFSNYVGDPRVMEGVKYVSANYFMLPSGFWWHNNKMNALCDKPGVTVEQVTRRVNGGINGLAERKRYFQLACEVIK